MPPMSPIEVVLKFEQVINSRNPDSISELLTPDSTFIDSLGNRVAGIDKLRTAWTGYFKMVPDYLISHSFILSDGETVAMFGTAQGTFSGGGPLEKENFWQTPAAWRAVVNNGKVALWQVFADNEPLRAIMRRQTTTMG